jgi:hypothetical protein
MQGERKRFFVLAMVLAVFALASVAAAQVLTGTITGTVTDANDLPIAGARVTVVDLSTGTEHSATTNDIGEFTVTELPIGFYKVSIEAPNFAKYTVASVQVNVSQTAKVVAKLKVATVGTEVVVVSQQSVVDTESAELKSSIDREQIMNLPLPTRNPLDLVRGLPGIVTPTSSGIADAFVHGLRGNSTNITQDGVNVADNFVKTSSFFAISAPTVDTVGEFNVSIGGIGVDAGFGAAQVSIVTQRGSSDFHGSLFWFQRTNEFNANTWFNNAQGIPRPFQLQNRLGASAGGPLFIPKAYDGRKHTWLFGSYEAFREPLSRSRSRTVLSDAARTGMFTYNDLGGVSHTVNLLALPAATTNTGGPPAINAAVMNFYNSLVPSPNGNLGCSGPDGVNIRCFTFNLPGTNRQDRYTLRLDHQLTQNHSIEGVFNQANFVSTPDLLNGIEPQFPKSLGGAQTSRRQVFTGAFHSVFGQNKTNEARVGVQRAPVVFALSEAYAGTNGFQLTTPGTLTDPTLTQNNLPQGRNTPVRQVTDNFAWVKGHHSFRFGGEFRQVIANSFFFNTVVPRVFLGQNASSNPDGLVQNGAVCGPPAPCQFPGGISAANLTRAQTVFDMVTGLLNSVQQGFNHTSPTSGFVKGVPRTVDPIQQSWAGYFQDTFKARPNLTLTAGLRYEYQGVFDLRNGLVLLPQGGFQGLWGPTPVNQLFTPTNSPVLTDTQLGLAGGNNGSPIYNGSKKNFAPFLGFAWDPFKSGKTSIRGGGTMHYTQDGFTLFQLASTGNTGLFSVVANNIPAGVFNAGAVPTPAAPADTLPVVSQRTNFTNNTGANLWFFNPNLRTPYVVEWNLSVSRETWKRLTVEARYVGNRGIALYRAYSINELNLLNSPFTFGGNGVANILTEFKNAQNNLAINQAAGVNSFANRGLPGEVSLPIFSALFVPANIPPGVTTFTNSTFITQLKNNEIGRMFDTLRRSNNFAVNRLANFPLNFFVANPFANGANMVDNSSWSTYHGAEIEVRRRFSSGLSFQANYTFSKVLTDTRFLTSQAEQQNYLSLANRSGDKSRAAFDITQSVAANFIYPLPFGRGRWLGGNAKTFVDKIIGGFQVEGTTRISTGAPFNILTGSAGGNTPRLTLGSLEATTPVLRNMDPSQLQKSIGVFETATGVSWLDPKLGLTKCTAGQTTPCFDTPGPGQNGNLPYFGYNGPRFIDQDLGILKRTNISKLSEKFNFEVRFEFFNLFNHPNFGGLSTSIEDSNFGQLTNTVDTVRGGGVTSRLIQWALRVNW